MFFIFYDWYGGAQRRKPEYLKLAEGLQNIGLKEYSATTVGQAAPAWLLAQ